MRIWVEATEFPSDRISCDTGIGETVDIKIVHVFHDGGAGWRRETRLPDGGERRDCRGRRTPDKR